MHEGKVTDSDDHTIGGSPEPCSDQKFEVVVPSSPSCETSQAVEESQTSSEPQPGCLKSLHKRPLTHSEEKTDPSTSGTDATPASDSDSDGEYRPSIKKFMIAQKKGRSKTKGKNVQDQVPKKKRRPNTRQKDKADEKAKDGPFTGTDRQTQTRPYPPLEVPETTAEFLSIAQDFIEKQLGRAKHAKKSFKDLEKVYEEHEATFENSVALLQQQKTTLEDCQEKLAIERGLRLDREAENEQLQATNEELENEKQALESQIQRLIVDDKEQKRRIVSLLEEKRAETAANKVSDDTIISMWRTLAYNVLRFTRTLTVTPREWDIEPENIPLPIQELARRCISQPTLQGRYLQQHILSKLAQSVFGNECILWPSRAGTAFAKFCHELSGKLVTHTLCFATRI